MAIEKYTYRQLLTIWGGLKPSRCHVGDENSVGDFGLSFDHAGHVIYLDDPEFPVWEVDVKIRACLEEACEEDNIAWKLESSDLIGVHCAVMFWPAVVYGKDMPVHYAEAWRTGMPGLAMLHAYLRIEALTQLGIEYETPEVFERQLKAADEFLTGILDRPTDR